MLFARRTAGSYWALPLRTHDCEIVVTKSITILDWEAFDSCGSFKSGRYRPEEPVKVVWRPSSSSSIRLDFAEGYLVRIYFISRRIPAYSGPVICDWVTAKRLTKAATSSFEYCLLYMKTIVMHLTNARKSLMIYSLGYSKSLWITE